VADPTPWTRHAWHGVAEQGRYGATGGPAGVAAALCAPASIALASALKGAGADCRTRLSAHLGVPAELLVPLRAVWGRDRAAFWTGPERWLVVAACDVDLESELARALGDTAAIADQSDGRFLLRLTGSKVRDCLAKGVAIDLHPRVFRAGDTAPVLLSHLQCQLARRAEADTYDLIGPRAAAGDIWHWLVSAAAEYGLELELPA
jgi:methylglutamate dehydrogenase subunit D